MGSTKISLYELPCVSYAILLNRLSALFLNYIYWMALSFRVYSFSQMPARADNCGISLPARAAGQNTLTWKLFGKIPISRSTQMDSYINWPLPEQRRCPSPSEWTHNSKVVFYAPPLQCEAFHCRWRRWYKPWKSLGFYNSGEPEIALRNPWWLRGFSFAQISSLHQDRVIEWRSILYPTHHVLLQPPTTHTPRILYWFRHTLWHARMYSSSRKDVRTTNSGEWDVLNREHRRGQF